MFPEAQKILDELYDMYRNKSYAARIDFKEMDADEKRDWFHWLEYLEQKELIDITMKALGYWCFEFTAKGLDYMDNSASNVIQPQTINYNFGDINASSIIGNQQSAVVNVNASIDEIKRLIALTPAEDQKELTEMVEVIQEIEQSDKPVKRNFLSKFSDVLAKHSNIVIALVNTLVQLFAQLISKLPLKLKNQKAG